MNVRVEAGPIAVRLMSVANEASVYTESNVVTMLPVVNHTWACFTSYVFSINGHSVNAINPDFEVGEVTTSILA